MVIRAYSENRTAKAAAASSKVADAADLAPLKFALDKQIQDQYRDTESEQLIRTIMDMRNPGYGLADIAHHVIDTRFEPSCLQLNGVPRRGEQYLPGPLPATSSTPDTHVAPSFLESSGIPRRGEAPAMLRRYWWAVVPAGAQHEARHHPARGPHQQRQNLHGKAAHPVPGPSLRCGVL